MSKEDRYSHLSDGSETAESASEEGDGIHVTVSDGAKEVKVYIEGESLPDENPGDRIENLFADLGDESNNDAAETDRLATYEPLAVHRPLTDGIDASGALVRATITSGAIGLNIGAAWMAAFASPPTENESSPSR
ncbi:hypothetical protein C491_15767 [Natronococcus amylolyticus DSM 10524]|uniref:Uncharacterized protein n=1 Tax=Natronococcus amylolyticus DSM 10524 TaxID=1227497 RepID=L9X0A8_9EURY|nr:hypothetical protein [Natronococcus amylolyticus]ELY55189.1 hypothetical protein C491_15767 [Natronococcus amylolyticus DSM 10524]